MTTRFEDWVRSYVRAWNTNEPEDIKALFTDDALYYTEPFAEPWRGHEGIVQGWLEAKDRPGDTDFAFEMIAVDGDLGIVRGHTHYKAEDRGYDNLWVLRLDDAGRCSHFTEWWMEVPKA